MTNQRGFTLVELLVTVLVTGIVLLAAGSLYVATTRAFDESSSQGALQRQGTIALDEIGRQVHIATAIAAATCNGHANSLQVTNAAGSTHCYYVGSNGELCQYTTACRNLLAGALRPHVPRSQAQLTATSLTATLVAANQVDVAFTISDGLNNAMTFQSSLTCSGRNC